MEKFDPALLARVAESRMGLEIEEQKLKAGVYEELEREPKPFIVTETPLYMGIMNVQMLANAKCKQKASASEKE